MAIQLVGQDTFKKECAILKRLLNKFGAAETERFLIGAQLMQWRSLRSLGSADGLGRRMALKRFWDSQRGAAKMPDQLKAIMREMSR